MTQEEIMNWAAVIIVGVCLVAGLGSVLLGKAVEVFDRARGDDAVNTFEEAPTVVMSRKQTDAALSSRPSLQTDGVQTPDQTEDASARRAKLLDTYRPLRKLGMSRDDARAFLKPWGIPLDNNLWTEAAPEKDEDADMMITPIAGRPTRAPFRETDPELAYQPPRS